MLRGSFAKRCYWCDRNVTAASGLFVNGHGWTETCETCVEVIAPAPALLARAR